MPATNANAAKLSAFIADAIARAPSKANPAEFLQQSAEKVRSMLRQIDAGVTPPHLVGLTAWVLADAADALEAAASRKEAA